MFVARTQHVLSLRSPELYYLCATNTAGRRSLGVDVGIRSWSGTEFGSWSRSGCGVWLLFCLWLLDLDAPRQNRTIPRPVSDHEIPHYTRRITIPIHLSCHTAPSTYPYPYHYQPRPHKTYTHSLPSTYPSMIPFHLLEFRQIS